MSATDREATIIFIGDGSFSVDEESNGTIDRSRPDRMATSANVCR